MSNSIKKLAGETIIYGLGAILPKFVNYLFIASYLTYQMKSEKYGIHGILYSFVTIAIVLFTLRMETTFFKFASNKNLNSSEVYNTAMSIVIVSSTVLFTFILFFQNQIAAILTALVSL